MSILIFGSMDISESSPEIQLTMLDTRSAFPSEAKYSFENARPDPTTTTLWRFSPISLSKAAAMIAGPLISRASS